MTAVSLVMTGLLLSPAVDARAVAPDSLVVGEIEYVSEDVFTREEVAASTGLSGSLRRAMNALHIQTREWVVQGELLFAPGDRFDPDRLAETERNLRRLGRPGRRDGGARGHHGRRAGERSACRTAIPGRWPPR